MSERDPMLNPANEWEKVPHTPRGLDEYISDLNLAIQDLRDKKILDIGSGRGNFAKDLENLSVGAEVFSLDPLYSLPKPEQDRLTFNKMDKPPDLSLGGTSEALPFNGNSFDLIVADGSIPLWAAGHDADKKLEEYRQRVTKSLDEMDRVLRNGGEIRIYPFGVGESIGVTDSELARINLQALQYMAEKNYTYSLEPDTRRSNDPNTKLLILKKSD